MKILLANNEDLDQMPHHVASDLGLHCLPMIFLQVSRQKWVKQAVKPDVNCIIYSQTCLKGSSKGRTKSGCLRQVTL